MNSQRKGVHIQDAGMLILGSPWVLCKSLKQKLVTGIEFWICAILHSVNTPIILSEAWFKSKYDAQSTVY